MTTKDSPVTNYERVLNPKEYFDIIKNKKQNITSEDLLNIYNNCEALAEKYLTTGQTNGLQKIIFYMETIQKEIDVVKLGVNTFVYKSDIEDYIDNIADDVVKITELKDYDREIPDEIVDIVSQVKDKFNKLYVVFTDYTGKAEKKIEKARIEKDPILFGTFQDKTSKTIIERFYFLGDWVDEYCDLTFDKMVNEIKSVKSIDPTRTITLPENLEDLKTKLKALNKAQDNNFINISDQLFTGGITIQGEKPTTGFFKNIRTFFSKIVK